MLKLNLNDFTYESYKSLIILFQRMSFVFVSFEENFKSNQRGRVILRHDVDLSLDKALNIAKIDKSLGISSTFFLLISSPFYNLNTYKSLSIVKQIIKMNHSIGLHFDITNYKVRNQEEFIRKLDFEINLLSSIIGISIEKFSLHRPASYPVSFEILKDHKGFVHSSHYKNCKYISDSSMNWRENVLEYLELDAFANYQLNIHPIWYDDLYQSKVDKLYNFLQENLSSSLNEIENTVGIRLVEKTLI